MIVCSQCGHGNATDDAFCGSCGAFLEWVGEKVVEADPAPAPTAAPEAVGTGPGIVARLKSAVTGEDRDDRSGGGAPEELDDGAGDAVPPGGAADRRAVTELAAARAEAEAAEARAQAQLDAAEAQVVEASKARRAAEESAARAEAEAAAVRRRTEAEAAARDDLAAKARAAAEAEAVEARARAAAEAEEVRLEAATAKARAEEAAVRAEAEAAAARAEGHSQAELARNEAAAARAEAEARISEARAEAEANVNRARAEAEAARADAEEARERAEAETRARAVAEAAEASARQAAEVSRAKAVSEAAARTAAEAAAAQAMREGEERAAEVARRQKAMVARPSVPAPKPTPTPGPTPQKPTEEKRSPVAPRRPQPATRTIRPGDLICGQCGEVNDLDRKFCRRCGESLVAAVVAKTPWWRRVFHGRATSGPPAGTRKGRDDRGGEGMGAKGREARRSARGFGRKLKSLRGKARSILALLAILGIATIAIGPGRGVARDVWERVQRVISPQYDAVRPVSASATSSAPGRDPGLLIDGIRNSFWAEGAAGTGVGQTITLTFAEPTDIDRIGITPGATEEPGQFVAHPRPRELHIVMNGSEVLSSDITVGDQSKFQDFDVDGRDVTSVVIEIRSVHVGTSNEDTAIAELELFVKQ